jgi:hypothetical protein
MHTITPILRTDNRHTKYLKRQLKQVQLNIETCLSRGFDAKKHLQLRISLQAQLAK